MHAPWDTLARRGAIGATLAALLLGSTACAGSTSSNAPKAAASPSSAPSDRPAVTHAAGLSSCAGVKKVFLDLATVSASWDPRVDPFDAHTAAAFGPLIHQLRTESRSATSSRLRVAVDRNADALADLAAAMQSHQQARFTAALAKSRSAYAALPHCARRGGRVTHARTSATARVSGGTSSAAPPSQLAGPSSSAAKDPGCVAAKAAYAKLAPVTTKWDITSDPFDSKVADAFRSTADALEGAADAAKASGIATRAKANADAFGLLADSMSSKDAAKVDDSVITMQQTAVTLATACPLS